jgi:signal peptidase I
MMEWLANLSLKWVLVAVGLLLLARLAVRRRVLLSPATAFREFIDAALVAVVVVFLVIRPYVAQAYFIPSESMHPTLLEGDRILVNKAIHHFEPPVRGEIAVFLPPEDKVPELKDYIKRVIGLPGETLEVVPERLLVDGRTVMRFTDKSASDVRREDLPAGSDIGFTYALRGGSVRLEKNVAVVTGEFGADLKVTTFTSADVIRQDSQYVYLNNQMILAPVFGAIRVTHNLRQWGGAEGLEGNVYVVNGTPRLVLVRGDRLTHDPGHVTINGRRLEEPYVAEPPAYALAPIQIPPGQYFMMGDNRNQSFDSHAWGPLPRERIIGRAEFIFWPPNRWRSVQHH